MAKFTRFVGKLSAILQSKRMTAEERSERARNAVKARWAKRNDNPVYIARKQLADLRSSLLRIDGGEFHLKRIDAIADWLASLESQ
jgi:hypothetical protein